MSDAVEAAGRTARQLSAEVHMAAGLADQLAADGLAQADDPCDAAVAARRLLADVKDAIESAQSRAGQLDAAFAHAGRVLPFLAEGWPSRRARLQRAIDADARDGLASWLADWFAAASGHRVNALRRLQHDVVLPPGADVLRERLAAATAALADDNWPGCQRVLRSGADGVGPGPEQVTDPHGHGNLDLDGTVREGLRLLAARLALRDGNAADASAVLDEPGPWPHPAARDALRAGAARLSGRDSVPGEQGDVSGADLLAKARESDPFDLDVTAETITRRRGDSTSALDSARAAIRARPALYDASDDVGRLVAPPAELWIALAERAADEEDPDSAWPFLDRAADAAEPDDYEAIAAVWELRASLGALVTGAGRPVHAAARRAYFYAGRARTSAGQLELARQDYEMAVSGEVASAGDEAIRAWARLSLADVIAQISRRRLSLIPSAELQRALDLLNSGRAVANVDRTEPWSYLTEADLRTQLSRLAEAADRREQEWTALCAAPTAVSRLPGWVVAWLALADAAMTCDLYRVAEAAAGLADQIAEEADSDREAARAGHIRALVNTGQYARALDKLGKGDGTDPWYRCQYGLIALRQGDADAAVRHFTGVAIAPTWYWAWHSYICALALAKGADDARRASADFLRATAGRAGERPRIFAAVFDALLRDEPGEALTHADELATVAGQGDPKALRAKGEALIVARNPKGRELIAQSLVSDPRPANIDEWEAEDYRVLALLTGFDDAGPRAARQPGGVREAHAMRYPSDPVAELRQAVKAALDIESAPRAAGLTEAVLLAGREPSGAVGQPVQPASEPVQPTSPAVVLRLPAAWFTGDSTAEDRPGHTSELRERHRELQGLLREAGPEPQLVSADDLGPDGYQIFVDGTLRATGHVEPGLRYCPRETLPLLPEHVRKSPFVIATDHGVGMPSHLLRSEGALGDLLTWSAEEVIAAQYHDVAGEYRRQPCSAPKRVAPLFLPPYRYPSLQPRQLSHRLWRLTSRTDDKANWSTAEWVRDKVTQEPAYFRWINRGQPPGDPLTDWHGAERELGTG